MSEHKPVYIGVDPAGGDDEHCVAIALQAGSKLVCTAVRGESEVGDAIVRLAMAAREQTVYTPQELRELTERLERTRVTVKLWLKQHGYPNG